MKPILSLTILLLIHFSCARAQDSSATKTAERKVKHQYFLSPGIAYQSQFFAELNLMRVDPNYGIGPCEVPAAVGPRIGVEANFNTGGHFYIAPKVAVEADITPLCIRLGMLYYMGNGQQELRFCPRSVLALPLSSTLLMATACTLAKTR